MRGTIGILALISTLGVACTPAKKALGEKDKDSTAANDQETSPTGFEGPGGSPVVSASARTGSPTATPTPGGSLTDGSTASFVFDFKSIPATRRMASALSCDASFKSPQESAAYFGEALMFCTSATSIPFRVHHVEPRRGVRRSVTGIRLAESSATQGAPGVPDLLFDVIRSARFDGQEDVEIVVQASHAHEEGTGAGQWISLAKFVTKVGAGDVLPAADARPSLLSAPAKSTAPARLALDVSLLGGTALGTFEVRHGERKIRVVPRFVDAAEVSPSAPFALPTGGTFVPVPTRSPVNVASGQVPACTDVNPRFIVWRDGSNLAARMCWGRAAFDDPTSWGTHGSAKVAGALYASGADAHASFVAKHCQASTGPQAVCQLEIRTPETTEVIDVPMGMSVAFRGFALTLRGSGTELSGLEIAPNASPAVFIAPARDVTF